MWRNIKAKGGIQRFSADGVNHGTDLTWEFE
jgi:hypothetical protein